MFKNKKFEVKMMKDDKPGEERLSLRQPIDRLDIEILSREIAIDITTAYVVIKSFKTLCGMAEHIVVTKVK